MTKLPRGFAGEAELLAERLRLELGIGNIAKLAPNDLARHLEIPVVSLSSLSGLGGPLDHLDAAIATLQGPEQASLSTLTVFAGTRRLIVYNDRHSAARQASDICHEVAHGLLLHQPTAALDERGCRAWNTQIELEADYLSGTLLVPGKAARWVAKSGMDAGSAAARFGCSPEMLNWRLNKSGARRFMGVD